MALSSTFVPLIYYPQKKTLLKYLLALTCLLLFYSSVFGQNGQAQIGARAAGMGYAYATESDAWSLFNNPAGLGYLTELSVIFSLENKYGIEGFNSIGAGIVSDVGIGTIGAAAFRFGDDLYNEQIVSLAYSNKFGIASLGFKVNLLQYNIEGFGSNSVASIDFGGIATITDALIFGAYIRNINQVKVAELADERAPTLLNAGLSYRPMEKLHLNLEAEKDLDYDATLRVGMEYMILQKLAARAGVNTEPFTNYAGLGFKTRRLQVDYAVTKDRNLGYSHQAAVLFKIKSGE